MDYVIVEENTDGKHKAQVGNVIVEESTDGEQKAEVGEEASLKETTANIIVEENTDAERTTQVGEEEASKEIVGNAIVEESTNVECTTQVGEEEAPKETTGHAIVEKSSDVEHTAQVGEEALKETMDNAIVEESANRAQVGEETTGETAGNVMVVEHKYGHNVQLREEVLNETVGNDIVEENTDGKHKTQVGEKETLSETVGSVIVTESTDGENKAEAGKEGVLNESMGNLFVEEITDGKHNAQVRREEASNETTGNVIVKESTAGEHWEQVEEEEVLNGTVSNAIFEQSTDGEHKAEVRKEAALDETMDDIIVVASTDGELKGEVREEEAFDETMNISEEEEALNKTAGNIILEESNNGEHKTEIRKGAVLDETMCDVSVEKNTDGELKGEAREEAAFNETMDIIKESTDGEHMAQVGEEEANKRMDNLMAEESSDGERKAQVKEEELNETEKQAMQSMASGTRTIPLMENDQYVSYHLSFLDKAHFSVSDLVWGKVKSHPWWPGQIFDLSDATKLAMKYQKNDSFLIGYFGDKTFAWCDESQLKPFHSYFLQLEKQCSSDTFIKAIHDILTEVARRVELGMACSCLPEEDYTNVKYQKVENAGIRGGNINSIIDRSTVANYFQPARLLEYIQTLAQFPNGRVDRLEFVIAQSQLKAFYHSKGYPELPVFAVGGGLVESVPENSPSNGKRTMEDIAGHCTPIPSDLISAKGKLRSEQSSLNKQEHGSMDDDKQENISKRTEVRTGAHLENGGKSRFVAKAAEKPISSSSGKKHIIVESYPVDSGRCKKRMLDSCEDMEIRSPSPTVASSFKIGEFIRRAASQLTGGPPIVKCQGDTLQKCAPQAEHKKDDIADFDVFPDSPIGIQIANLSFIEDDNSTEEMLSQLCLAATNPMEEFSFVSTVVTFFTCFRNYCVSSSLEDEEHVKEHVEKRKRGRPRKVIAQLASSDVGSSEDEKHVEKRKRGMLTNVISQLASSDTSSEDEKPVEKPVERCKRGRPRKNHQPDSSDSSEDNKPVQKPQKGRPRGRPKKEDAQLACPDYSSSENKKLVEKRKRGRPKKVNTEIVPSDMSVSNHMKDSYWSDMDLQHKRNSKAPMQYQRKRRKSTGEKSLSLPANPVQEIEQQLQLIAMNPNLKLTFIAERSIISVEEKIVDECMPTALILSFNNANSLPSETDLIRIFSRYGPLKEAETDVLRKANRAKVIFKRRVDAETAFSSAGKYSIFGPGLLSYQLKPWTPRSTLQGIQDAASTLTPQDTHGVAPIAAPQENSDAVGNHDAAPITTPQDNHDTAFIATPLDKHDLGSITTAAPVTMVQGNDDAAVGRPHDTGPTEQSNLEFSEQVEAVMVLDAMQIDAENMESSPYDKHAPLSIASQEGNQNVVPVTSSLNVRDLLPDSIQEYMDAAPSTIVQDNHDAAGIIALQEKCEVGPSVGSTLEFSEQAEDVIASDTKQVEAEGKESLSPNDNGDPALIATPQENPDSVPVILLPIPTSTQEKLDAAPIIMVQDNHDIVKVIRPTVGSNLEISEQAEDVITPDTMQVEAESKESSPHGGHDPTPIPMHQENQDAAAAASPLDEQYSVPTMTQDDLDAAPISMEQDGHDATGIITLHRCVEGPTVGSDLQLLEQAEVVMASDSVQVEAMDKESMPQGSHDSAVISTEPEQYQDTIPSASLLDEHDLKTHTSMQDNLDATPIAMVQDSHNVAAIITAQDKCDAEQAEDVIALDAMEVEPNGKESLPENAHDPTWEQNQDAEPVALQIDKHDSTPSMTQENLDAATISMPQDNQSATPLTAPHDNHDEATITTPQAHDAGPIGTLQDNVSTTTPPDHYVAASIAKQTNHHEAFIATLQDNHDSAQISTSQDWRCLTLVTAVQDNPHAVAAISLQEKCDAEPSIGSNSKPSEQAEDVITSDTIQVVNDRVLKQPEDVIMSDTIQVEAEEQVEDVITSDAIQVVNDHVVKQPEDVIMSDTIKVEAEGKKSLPENNDDPATSASEQNQDKKSIALLLDEDDSSPSTTEDKLDAEPISIPLDNHDPTPITTAQDNHDVSIATPPNYSAVPIMAPQDNLHATSIATPDDKHDLAQAEGSPDSAPITMVEDNHDAADIVLEDKRDAGSMLGSNLEISGGDKVSLPKAKDDPPTIATPQQNEGAESVATLVDEHDSTPTTAEKNLDGALVDTPEYNHGATPITTPQDTSDAAISGAGKLEVSEEVGFGVASETVQLEPECCKLDSLDVSGQIETEMASNAMQAQGEEPSE